ncbi:adenosine receptor A1-like [Ptychodera flava]|uniref:adenosine receptor A1-like n=1 Tax=Ptychodera flava TaxID=63121 RepID=UPI00396A993D
MDGGGNRLLAFNQTEILNVTNNNGTVIFSNDIAAAIRISILGALTVFGNTLVVASVIVNKELRATRYAFMASLACVDMLSGFYFTAGALLNAAPEIAGNDGHNCVYLLCVLFLLWSTSIFHMVLIAVDRYLIITNPFKYNETMTRFRCAGLIAGAWFSGGSVASLPLLGWQSALSLQEGIICTPSFVMSGEYLMFFCVGVFLLPLVVMCALYGKLAHIAFQQRRKIHALHNISNTTRNDLVTVSASTAAAASSSQATHSSPVQQNRLKIFKKEMRTTKTLVMILGAFAICWLPFSLMLVLEYIYPTFQSADLDAIAFSMGMGNSALNPVLYALRDVPLRKTLKAILKCQRV